MLRKISTSDHTLTSWTRTQIKRRKDSMKEQNVQKHRDRRDVQKSYITACLSIGSSLLRLGIALGLLVATGCDSQVALIARRVRRVCALVVLDVTRADERILEVVERGVAVNLKLAVANISPGGSGHTPKVSTELLEVPA